MITYLPLFFALFTDDIGFWTDGKRKIRGQADEKPAGSLFYICPFLRAEQKNDRKRKIIQRIALPENSVHNNY